jgi:hypothetical protein
MSGNPRPLRTSAITSAPKSMQPRLLDQFNRLSNRLASLSVTGIAAQTLTGMINAASELHHWRGITAKTAAGSHIRAFFRDLLPPNGRQFLI